jgi:putative acetyltransferase
MTDTIGIQQERPDQPDVVALLGALDRYLLSLYPAEAVYNMSVQELLEPEVRFLVARDLALAPAPEPGRIVGTGAYRRRPGESATGGERYGEIKRMYVDPTVRGKRIGSRLLQALESAMLEDGIELALLETGPEQTQAVRLYERSGYTLRGSFGGYPDSPMSAFYAKVL